MSHKKVPHKQNGRFYNHAGERKPNLILPSISMLIEWYWNSMKRQTIDHDLWFAPSEHAPKKNSDVSALHNPEKNLSLTWIGHSTFLIQTQGISILTDPIFGHLPLFRRQLPPGMSLGQLPPIDYILLSHNHRDHMDESALRFFKKHHTNFLVPHGDKAWFDKRKFTNVFEYTWWEQKIVTHYGKTITFTFLPALHWSQRGVFDYNNSLWGSWMIEIDGLCIYFAGDTAYSPHFEAIAKEFADISIALMPIGPCEPRRWMSHAHVSAEEAGQAFLDLKAKHFIPMHWGTFGFGTDTHQAPIERITQWWHQQNFQDKKLTIFKVGQRIVPEISDQPLITPPSDLITELGS